MEEKIVTVYYNDTPNSVSKKIGKYLGRDEDFLFFLFPGEKEQTAIPKNKIVRVPGLEIEKTEAVL